MFARGDFELGAQHGADRAAERGRGARRLQQRVPAEARPEGRAAEGAGRPRLNDRIEITSPLPDGAQVVVQGAGFLNDGDLVRVVDTPRARRARPAGAASAPRPSKTEDTP
jgi:hypothetical protein